MLKWIDCFLCFRQQRVVVNEVKSDWTPVSSGCSTGHRFWYFAVLIVYQRYLNRFESEIRLFADDCVCYREIMKKEDTVKLQTMGPGQGNGVGM